MDELMTQVRRYGEFSTELVSDDALRELVTVALDGAKPDLRWAHHVTRRVMRVLRGPRCL